MTEPRKTMVDVDLDALRKAGAGGKQSKTFRLDGHTYTVPGRLPFYVGILMADDRIEDSMRLWLGDEQEAILRKSSLDDEDFKQLFDQLYGVTPGESPDSEG